MESFVVTVNNIDYQVGLHSSFPKLFDVYNEKINYTIGKTDAGNWVYIKHEPSSAVIPLEQIGMAIDEHFADE
ncbi:hypothetical protein [Mucilaginibacter sp. SG564]|uniref:hypothetical protein n=1 Tax=unclassified Mucilaginibacter TaxID=2617802 RepID=UPI001555B9B4|nr:hypothetical protein [Mucilaginibacter sp. SG564]NOW97262.1 hypothetical protein [Mucilaginibacter sp. SG564]